MSLVRFAEEYGALPPGEQPLFAEAVRRLLADGLIWREDERDRRIYVFLLRRRDLVGDYLAVAGWDLRHDERAMVFQVVHRDGAHRRRLNRETTIWLLLLRLIYAEQRESTAIMLTRNPTIPVGGVVQRYAEFFSGKPFRKKTSLDEALRTLQHLKLVRPAGGGPPLRAANNDQLIELLPTLEVVVPAAAISAISEQIAAYNRAAGAEDDEEEGA